MAINNMNCPTGFLSNVKCEPKVTETKIWYLDITGCLVSGVRRQSINCSPVATDITQCFDALGVALLECPKELSVQYAVTASCSSTGGTNTPPISIPFTTTEHLKLVDAAGFVVLPEQTIIVTSTYPAGSSTPFNSYINMTTGLPWSGNPMVELRALPEPNSCVNFTASQRGLQSTW